MQFVTQKTKEKRPEERYKGFRRCFKQYRRET